MPRKFKDIIKLIEKDGWVLVAQVGSHRQYKHPTKPGRVTIAAHKISDDISLKTEASYFKASRIKVIYEEAFLCTKTTRTIIFSPPL